MNPYEMIKFHESQFTKSDRLIAEAILANPHYAISFNITIAAAKMNTSTSALLRFCKKLGFKGYTEFRYELSRYVHSGESEENPITDDSERMDYILQIYQEAFMNFKNSISCEELNEFAFKVINAKRIKTFGVHRSSLSAMELQMRLLKIGIECQAVTDPQWFEPLIDSIKEKELHIYFSISSTTASILSSIAHSQEKNADILLITQNPNVQLEKGLNQIIQLPSLNFSHKDFFLDVQILNFAFIELLISSISKIQIKSN